MTDLERKEMEFEMNAWQAGFDSWDEQVESFICEQYPATKDIERAAKKLKQAMAKNDCFCPAMTATNYGF